MTQKIKSKQDVFEFLQGQYFQTKLLDSDITAYRYGKRYGIPWRTAKRLLKRAVESGILLEELVLDGTGKRINRYIPIPGWENKTNGNIFAQISQTNGHKPAGDSNGPKKSGVRSH